MRAAVRPSRSARLIRALRELADEESQAVSERDVDAVLALAQRSGPLVDELCAHESLAPAELAELNLWRAQRERNSQQLEQAMQEVQLERGQLALAQRRLALTAPAYGARAGQEISGRFQSVA